MPQAFKCKTCGEIVNSLESHRCPKNFTTVSLDPKDYCAMFGHSNEETEIPQTRKIYDRLQRVSENEERFVKFEGHEVQIRCNVCGSSYRKWKERWIG